MSVKFVRDATIYKNQVIFLTEYGEVISQPLEGGECQTLQVLQPKKTCSHGQEEKGKRVRIKSVTAGINHILFLSFQDELWAQGKGPALGLFTNKIDNEITNPARIDFFKGRRVLQMEAGSYFTVALVETLSSSQQNSPNDTDQLPDFDSCVRSCELCRKETGDRILFDDDHLDKCPLGLGVRKDCKITDLRCDMLSPTPSSINLDGRSSRNSNTFQDDAESSDCIRDDMDATSGGSCETTGVNTPIDDESDNKRCHKQSIGSEFEIVDCNYEDSQNLGDNEAIMSSTPGKGLFMNADAARQYITKQLSRMTTNGADYVDFAREGTEKLSHKYPIDTATVILKENVANVANAASSAASMVATGVKTVSDKVGQISRHFSSSDCTENEKNDFELNNDGQFDIDVLFDSPVIKTKKCDSFECNSLPRKLSNDFIHKKTHSRTGSGSVNFTKLEKNDTLLLVKEPGQILQNTKSLIEIGKNLINTEVKKFLKIIIHYSLSFIKQMEAFKPK